MLNQDYLNDWHRKQKGRRGLLVLSVIMALAFGLGFVTGAYGGDVPVNRIYQADRKFHFYTPNRSAWRVIESRKNRAGNAGINDPKFCKDTGDAFIASSVKLSGTFALKQWRDRGGTKYFYTKGSPPDPENWIESTSYDGAPLFYVWEQRQPGLVPVYCSGRPDNSDVYFTTDRKQHEAYIELDEKRGIERLNLGVVFYAKPPAKPKKERLSRRRARR